MRQTTPAQPGPGVLDRFLAVAAEALDPDQRRRVHALSVAPGDAGEERYRACELLTRVRDWTAAALGEAGASVPMLPPGPIRTGDDAFQLLRALEPVADEMEAVDAEPALRELVGAATAAARSGTELGPLPAGGLGSVRAPGVGSHVVEEITPADDDLLDVGRRAGQVLDGWASAGLGDRWMPPRRRSGPRPGPRPTELRDRRLLLGTGNHEHGAAPVAHGGVGHAAQHG